MLQLGGLKAGETMFDLGSGRRADCHHGRQKFHARAVGIELNQGPRELSSDKIRKLKLEQTASIVNGDLLKQDYSSADLITLYLFPGLIDKVQPHCSTGS